jgi:hypothetical protein
MPKKNILILICLVLMFFLVSPKILAQEKVSWPLQENQVENFLDIIRKEPLTQENYDLFFESIQESNPNAPRKTGAVVLVKQAILNEQLEYWFKEKPLELSKKFIKNVLKVGLTVVSEGSYEISEIISDIEKLTVEEATEYAINWLFKNELKIGTGELTYSFYSYKDNPQEIKIQYIILSRFLNENEAEIIAEFYSKNPIEPPLGTGPSALVRIIDDPRTTCWAWDRWLINEEKRDNDGKLESFILRVKGKVKTDRFTRFYWNQEEKPIVEIDFDNPVPEIENSDFILENPPSETLFFLNLAKNYLEKIKEASNNTIKSAKDNTVSFIDSIKNYLSQLEPSAQIAQQQPKEKVVVELHLDLDFLKTQIKRITDLIREKLEESTIASPKKQATEEADLELEKLYRQLEEMKKKLEVIKKEIGLLEKEGDKILEKKENICPLPQAFEPERESLIFNKLAWMGTLKSSNDEWIELKNISEEETNLFNWQILDKRTIEGESGGIKIFFGKTIIEPNELLILERTDDNTLANISADLIYKGSLGNSNEALYLFDQDCNLQDIVRANPDWPGGNNSNKKTMERKSNFSWQTSKETEEEPENNEQESYSYGGGTSYISYPKIIINEIQITGLGKESNQLLKEDFVELYNLNDSAVNMSNWYLQRKTENASDFSTFVPKNLFSNKTINPKDYLLIANSSSSFSADIYTDYPLTENNSLIIKNPNREIVDMVGWGQAQDFEESPTINPPTGKSIGRKWSSADNTYVDSDNNNLDFEIQEPTPNGKNIKEGEETPINDSGKNQLPIARFEHFPISPIINQEIVFDASSSTDPDGKISSYYWDFGDNTTTTSNNATTSHTYATSTQFEIYLKVFDNDGLSADVKKIIEVSLPETSTEEIRKLEELDVVINEIAWMGTQADWNDEWIELHNNKAQDINLNDCSVNWGEGTTSHSIVLEGRIPSYGYYLLERTASTTITDVLENQIYSGSLKNEGEKIELRDSASNLIDQVDCSEGWFAGDNETKQTMERISPKNPGNNINNWGNNNKETINGHDAENNPILGTPKAKNSILSSLPPNPVPGFSLDKDNSEYNNVSLVWLPTTDPDTPAEDISYIIYWAKEKIGEDSISSSSDIYSTTTATTSLKISPLDYDSGYYFAIKAFDGESYSSIATTTPYYTPLPPINDLNGGPSALRESIDIFWEDIGATEYILRYGEREIKDDTDKEEEIKWKDAIGEKRITPVNGNGSIIKTTVSNLSPDKKYFFALKSVNSKNATSQVSNCFSAKTIPGFQDNGETIKDLYTGLIWPKDGNSPACNNGATTTQSALINHLNLLNNSTSSINDWRIPNFKELATLLNYDSSIPAIDNLFTNTKLGEYWTNIKKKASFYPSPPQDYKRYYVDFSNSDADYHYCTGGNSLAAYGRFVRGPISESPILSPGMSSNPSYECALGQTENGETVSDNCTELMWVKGGTKKISDTISNSPLSSKPRSVTWEEALKICANLEIGGYDDWRLPNALEIIISSSPNNMIFPNESGYDSYYWSTTITKNNTWAIGHSSNNGTIIKSNKNNKFYTQCVRNIN